MEANEPKKEQKNTTIAMEEHWNLDRTKEREETYHV